DGAVPLVGLEPEYEVVAPRLPEAVELRAQAEGDRAPRVTSPVAHAEAQVLAVADRGQVAELAGRQQQRHRRVGEAEGRQARELPADDDRVDDGPRAQVVVSQRCIRMLRKRLGERIDLARVDREPGGRAMPPEPLQMLRTGSEPAVQVEHARRTARSLPVPV